MKTRHIILLLLGIIALSACDDMFEPADENKRSESAMVEESSYAHGLLMYGYARLPYLTTTQTDVATDDAVPNVTTNNSYWEMAANGTWRSDNNPVSVWDACKDGIQYVNLFLTKVELVKWAPSAASKQQMFVDRLKGEAYGLRALFYYYLLQAHGGYADDGVLYGVPLLTKPEDGSSNFNQPRATFADCVKQCFADCDSAMFYLPADYMDLASTDDIPAKYRAMGAQVSGYNLVFGDKSRNLLSGKVAEAVKAQVALLAASPAFRDQSGVTSAEAATLCANVLKRIGGMEGFDPTGNLNWYSSAYKNVLEGTAPIPEILWRADRAKNTSQETENFPPSLYGSGRVNPTQNLVDAFPMANGYPITDAASGYDASNPYDNRDPRLRTYILVNGDLMGVGNTPINTAADATTLDGLNRENGSSTVTGYYLRKLLRDDINLNPSSTTQQRHFGARIRATEIFLDYAEAANEASGPKANVGGAGFSAYDVIKAIRQRAGVGGDNDPYLEECAASQEKMRQLIRNERRLELCFENHRFWDLRRWKVELSKLNETARGMQIDQNSDGTLQYTLLPNVETRNYKEYMYYGPIPYAEIIKWSNLEQNQGW